MMRQIPVALAKYPANHIFNELTKSTLRSIVLRILGESSLPKAPTAQTTPPNTSVGATAKAINDLTNSLRALKKNVARKLESIESRCLQPGQITPHVYTNKQADGAPLSSPTKSYSEAVTNGQPTETTPNQQAKRPSTNPLRRMERQR
jgi:HAMP domain-containing protein